MMIPSSRPRNPSPTAGSPQCQRSTMLTRHGTGGSGISGLLHTSVTISSDEISSSSSSRADTFDSSIPVSRGSKENDVMLDVRGAMNEKVKKVRRAESSSVPYLLDDDDDVANATMPTRTSTTIATSDSPRKHTSTAPRHDSLADLPSTILSSKILVSTAAGGSGGMNSGGASSGLSTSIASGGGVRVGRQSLRAVSSSLSSARSGGGGMGAVGAAGVGFPLNTTMGSELSPVGTPRGTYLRPAPTVQTRRLRSSSSLTLANNAATPPPPPPLASPSSSLSSSAFTAYSSGGVGGGIGVSSSLTSAAGFRGANQLGGVGLGSVGTLYSSATAPSSLSGTPLRSGDLSRLQLRREGMPSAVGAVSVISGGLPVSLRTSTIATIGPSSVHNNNSYSSAAAPNNKPLPLTSNRERLAAIRNLPPIAGTTRQVNLGVLRPSASEAILMLRAQRQQQQQEKEEEEQRENEKGKEKEKQLHQDKPQQESSNNVLKGASVASDDSTRKNKKVDGSNEDTNINSRSRREGSISVSIVSDAAFTTESARNSKKDPPPHTRAIFSSSSSSTDSSPSSSPLATSATEVPSKKVSSASHATNIGGGSGAKAVASRPVKKGQAQEQEQEKSKESTTVNKTNQGEVCVPELLKGRSEEGLVGDRQEKMMLPEDNKEQNVQEAAEEAERDLTEEEFLSLYEAYEEAEAARQAFDTTVLNEDHLRAISGSDDLSLVTSLEIALDTTRISHCDLIGKSMPTLEEIRFTGAGYSRIPSWRDMGARLQNLKILWISKCSLTDLSGIHFSWGLEEIYFSYNSVVSLEPLAALSSLVICDAEGNCVSSVKELDAFVGMRSLRNLSLVGNPVAGALSMAAGSLRATKLSFSDDLREDVDNEDDEKEEEEEAEGADKGHKEEVTAVFNTSLRKLTFSRTFPVNLYRQAVLRRRPTLEVLDDEPVVREEDNSFFEIFATANETNTTSSDVVDAKAIADDEEKLHDVFSRLEDEAISAVAAAQHGVISAGLTSSPSTSRPSSSAPHGGNSSSGSSGAAASILRPSSAVGNIRAPASLAAAHQNNASTAGGFSSIDGIISGSEQHNTNPTPPILLYADPFAKEFSLVYDSIRQSTHDPLLEVIADQFKSEMEGGMNNEGITKSVLLSSSSSSSGVQQQQQQNHQNVPRSAPSSSSSNVVTRKGFVGGLLGGGGLGVGIGGGPLLLSRHLAGRSGLGRAQALSGQRARQSSSAPTTVLTSSVPLLPGASRALLTAAARLGGGGQQNTKTGGGSGVGATGAASSGINTPVCTRSGGGGVATINSPLSPSSNATPPTTAVNNGSGCLDLSGGGAASSSFTSSLTQASAVFRGSLTRSLRSARPVGGVGVDEGSDGGTAATVPTLRSNSRTNRTIPTAAALLPQQSSSAHQTKNTNTTRSLSEALNKLNTTVNGSRSSSSVPTTTAAKTDGGHSVSACNKGEEESSTAEGIKGSANGFTPSPPRKDVGGGGGVDRERSPRHATDGHAANKKTGIPSPPASASVATCDPSSHITSQEQASQADSNESRRVPHNHSHSRSSVARPRDIEEILADDGNNEGVSGDGLLGLYDDKDSCDSDDNTNTNNNSSDLDMTADGPFITSDTNKDTKNKNEEKRRGERASPSDSTTAGRPMSSSLMKRPMTASLSLTSHQNRNRPTTATGRAAESELVRKAMMLLSQVKKKDPEGGLEHDQGLDLDDDDDDDDSIDALYRKYGGGGHSTSLAAESSTANGGSGNANPLPPVELNQDGKDLSKHHQRKLLDEEVGIYDDEDEDNASPESEASSPAVHKGKPTKRKKRGGNEEEDDDAHGLLTHKELERLLVEEGFFDSKGNFIPSRDHSTSSTKFGHAPLGGAIEATTSDEDLLLEVRRYKAKTAKAAVTARGGEVGGLSSNEGGGGVVNKKTLSSKVLVMSDSEEDPLEKLRQRHAAVKLSEEASFSSRGLSLQ